VTPMAHRLPPCGPALCATCRRSARRERLLAAAIYGLLAIAFVVAWLHSLPPVAS
jgi:hypothetical protein